MPFPDLTPRPDPARGSGVQELFAEATGIPDNGPNTFMIPFIANGINPNEIDTNKMKIFVTASRAFPGVTDATFTALSGDKLFITMDFAQAAPGVGVATVVVQIQHSLTR